MVKDTVDQQIRYMEENRTRWRNGTVEEEVEMKETQTQTLIYTPSYDYYTNNSQYIQITKDHNWSGLKLKNQSDFSILIMNPKFP